MSSLMRICRSISATAAGGASRLNRVKCALRFFLMRKARVLTPHISVFSTLPPLLSMTPLILVDHRLDLLRRHVLAGHENVLVERHGGPFSFVASSYGSAADSVSSRFDASDRRQALRAVRPERLIEGGDTGRRAPGRMPVRQASSRPFSPRPERTRRRAHNGRRRERQGGTVLDRQALPASHGDRTHLGRRAPTRSAETNEPHSPPREGKRAFLRAQTLPRRGRDVVRPAGPQAGEPRSRAFADVVRRIWLVSNCIAM